MKLKNKFVLKAQKYFVRYDNGEVIIFDKEYNKYKKTTHKLWNNLFSKNTSLEARDNLLETLKRDILTIMYGELELMDVLRELGGYIEGHSGRDEMRVLACILLIFKMIEKGTVK